MKISLAYSPCPNDTYLFAAIANEWIDTAPFEFEIIMADVEALNQAAANGKYDVSKLSFATWIRLKREWTLLDSGATLGFGCGPLLVTKPGISLDTLDSPRIAIPGKWTTANLLLGLAYPNWTLKEEMLFSEIEDAVVLGTVDAGLIIHENRFTYQEKGLVKWMDLGEWWESHSKCPIPLGCIGMNNTLPETFKSRFEIIIRKSLDFARENEDQVMEYVKQHAQTMDNKTMRQHIDLYVTDFSNALGEIGMAAVNKLEKAASSLISR